MRGRNNDLSGSRCKRRGSIRFKDRGTMGDVHATLRGPGSVGKDEEKVSGKIWTAIHYVLSPRELKDDDVSG